MEVDNTLWKGLVLAEAEDKVRMDGRVDEWMNK
jgi:uncharacterized protein YdeI (BOF family)